MKKLLTVIISFLFLTSAPNADVISEYISNLIPGDGDTEVSIDLRENYSPDFSILMVRELSSDTNDNTFTQLSLFNTEKDLKSSFGFETEERGISYSLNFEYDENIDISSGISFKRSDRNSATKSITAVTDNIGNFDVYTIDFSISYDTTDDFLYPTDGIHNSLYLEYAPNFISDDNYYKILYK